MYAASTAICNKEKINKTEKKKFTLLYLKVRYLRWRQDLIDGGTGKNI